jgi:hypothetical protein
MYLKTPELAAACLGYDAMPGMHFELSEIKAWFKCA